MADQLVIYTAAAAVVQVLIIGGAVVAVKGFFGVLDRFGVIANRAGKGLVDRAKNKGQEWKGNTGYQRGRSFRQQESKDYKNKRFAGKLEKRPTTRLVARGVAGNVNPFASGRAQRDVLSRVASGQAVAARNKAIDDEVTRLTNASKSLSQTDLQTIIAGKHPDYKSATQMAAASEMLIKSGAGGVDMFRAQIGKNAGSYSAEQSSAIVEGMRRNLDTLDRSSPDMADFARGGSNAALTLQQQSGGAFQAQAEIGRHYSWRSKTAEQLITITEDTAAEAAASGALNPANATLATQSQNFPGAKNYTRAVLDSVANGTPLPAHTPKSSV